MLNAVFSADAQQDQSQAAIENAVMNEIVPHLYLGNEMDAKDESKLEEKGIHYILNVTKNIPFYTNPNNSKFVHKRIAVNDCVSQNLKQHFDEAIQFIGKLSSCSQISHRDSTMSFINHFVISAIA